jgi:glycosyltransferase involved in cell wall biosynthesis
MDRKRIFLVYDHFYPAYKAGGPVQSLVNMVRALHTQYDFYVLCKPHEMNETVLLPGIKVNTWMPWEDGKANVYYRNYKTGQQHELQQLYSFVKPDVIFINGLFSLHFNIRPLQYAVAYIKQHKHCKLILSARGMLHPGALSQKPFKKKIFLAFFKLAGWHKQVHWHATDAQEQEYIQQEFGTSMNISTAGNFPNMLPVTSGPFKKEEELIMGTVALISPMKNHLAVLHALTQVSSTVIWHIYGPVKDDAYWKECEQTIAQLPPTVKIQYHGELPPSELATAMKQIQLFIMPSKSENFGHALLEALSAGKPVITTNTTPFKDLKASTAGYTVQIDKLDEQLPETLRFFASMNHTQFESYAQGAAAFARGFVNIATTKQQYQTLFSNG